MRTLFGTPRRKPNPEAPGTGREADPTGTDTGALAREGQIYGVPARKASRPTQPWAAGNVVYIDPEVVVRILSRILAMSTPPESVRNLAGRGDAERRIPSDLNAEWAGRIILSLATPHLADISPLAATGSSTSHASLPLVPGIPVKLTGLVRSGKDFTAGMLALWLGETRFQIKVRREESLHLNRGYFIGREMHVLGVVRSVPDHFVAAIITCGD